VGPPRTTRARPAGLSTSSTRGSRGIVAAAVRGR
jgi:hypothetical protein